MANLLSNVALSDCDASMSPALAGTRSTAPAAVESFNRAVSLAPGRHDLYWSLGEAHRRNGNWPDAATAYRQATSLAPDEARYHYSLARAYRKLDRTEEAIQSYEMALTLDPGNEAASRELAELRRR